MDEKLPNGGPETLSQPITNKRPRVSASPRSFRWRRFRFGAFATIIALSLVLILIAAFTRLGGGSSSVKVIPTPLAHPFSLVVTTNVNYGQLTLNGKPVTFSSNDSTLPIVLTQTQNTLSLAAAPFRPLACHIDVTHPSNVLAQGRCHLSGTVNGLPILDLRFIPDDLPVNQEQELLDTYNGEISLLNQLATTVQPNTHYATGVSHGFPQANLATAALRAQVSVTIGPPTSDSLDPCFQSLCPGTITGAFDANPPPYYVIEAQMSVGWLFFDNSGLRVAGYNPLDAQTSAAAGQALSLWSTVEMHVQYSDKGWKVIEEALGTSVFADSSKQVATNMCHIGAQLFVQKLAGGTTASFPSPASLDGCLFTVSTGNNSPTVSSLQGIDPTKDTHNAWILVHYGAVLVVNDLAQALAPDAPRATADEVSAVLQKALTGS